MKVLTEAQRLELFKVVRRWVRNRPHSHANVSKIPPAERREVIRAAIDANPAMLRQRHFLTLFINCLALLSKHAEHR